jgi:hypothetical protein
MSDIILGNGFQVVPLGAIPLSYTPDNVVTQNPSFASRVDFSNGRPSVICQIPPFCGQGFGATPAEQQAMANNIGLILGNKLTGNS